MSIGPDVWYLMSFLACATLVQAPVHTGTHPLAQTHTHAGTHKQNKSLTLLIESYKKVLWVLPPNNDHNRN